MDSSPVGFTIRWLLWECSGESGESWDHRLLPDLDLTCRSHGASHLDKGIFSSLQIILCTKACVLFYFHNGECSGENRCDIVLYYCTIMYQWVY